MKPHEKMSAILAANVFGEAIRKNGGNVELVVRMIIGCHFLTDSEHSFENAMIQLIHGDIIDADRLDYTLRDVWAAGYNTSTINVQRLIDNTLIEKGEDGLYEVCYSSKALNEIESVLNVKSFQNLYIFSHHKSVYEQKILIESMKSASEFHWYGNVSEDKNRRDEALGKTCDVNSMYTTVECSASHYKICHPMDDDFIVMMKYIQDDYYVNQWFSRKYCLSPLWKTKAEFYFLFGDLLSSLEKAQKNAILEWLGNGIRQELKHKFELSDKDLLVLPQNVKYSELDPKQIMIKIREQAPIPLCNLSHDGISARGSKAPFSYIYTRIDNNSKEDYIEFIKNRISELINSDILNVHPDEEI